MNLPTAPFLEIDLGSDGGVLSANNAAEVLQWINDEIAAWNWLANPAIQELAIQARKSQNAVIPPLREIASGLTSGNGNIEAKKQQFKDNFISSFRGGRAVHSKSLKGHFIDKLRSSSEAQAVGALLYFQNRVGTEFRQPAILSGAILAVLFEQGQYGTASAERAALGELHGEWSENLETAKTAFRESADEIARFKTSAQSSLTVFGETSIAQLEVQKQEIGRAHV